MLRRMLFEQRKPLLILAIVLAANAVVYAALVYPLSQRVAAADARAATATRARTAAEREFADARAVQTGKEQAENELRTFYDQVLPADLSAARRATSLTLARMARDHDLRLARRSASPEEASRGRLDQLKLALVLEGRYNDIRQFIHDVETAPHFVVIDELTIEHGRAQGDDLVLTLVLSTYFRANHGS